MTWRVLITEPHDFSPEAAALLGRFTALDYGPLAREKLLRTVTDCDALFIRLGHSIDAEVMAAAPKLKAIVTPTTGHNHIDMEEARRRNIAVLSLAGERDFLDTVQATAEHTIALMLALVRRLPMAHNDVLAGHWDRDRFKGTELNGRTLGVAGYGRLGRKTAHYGHAFGMTVLANDIAPVAADPFVEMTDLTSLLRRSDIVSVHIPANAQTEGFFGTDKFALMRKGALFINTSRGEVTDETALLGFLKNRHLGGAAVDVLRAENSGRKRWVRKDPLVRYARRHDNLIVTPHIGGATYDSMAKTEVFMAEKLEKFWRARGDA